MATHRASIILSFVVLLAAVTKAADECKWSNSFVHIFFWLWRVLAKIKWCEYYFNDLLGDCNCHSNDGCQEKNSPLCPVGEIFISGGSPCDTTCSALEKDCIVNNFVASQGCYCAPGYARLLTNECVPSDSPGCTEQNTEEFNAQPSKQADCSKCLTLDDWFICVCLFFFCPNGEKNNCLLYGEAFLFLLLNCGYIFSFLR